MSASEIPRRLLASIHDVSPRFESQVEALCERLDRHLGGSRFAMLVVPDHWDSAPLARSPAFRAKLRSWADGGVEMFLHGWNHRDDRHHRTWFTSLKARHMTAREGEFLGLDAAEAERRMREGRMVVEDVIGRPVSGFIAPAWLYGPGAREALKQLTFPLAEDHLRVWRPADGRTLALGPVVTWASRNSRRRLSSVAFAAVARHALSASPVVRLAVHPGDTAHPFLLQSIDRSLSRLLRRRQPARYGDLVRN